MRFWTCGPFMKAEKQNELVKFRITQQGLLQDVLKELQLVNDLIKNGNLDEKLLASMMKPDIEAKLNIILGIPNNANGQTESNEISREAIRKSISRIAKK